MFKSAVTISLVPEAKGGPFVFWDDLEQGCKNARELGFDAVELFLPDAEFISVVKLEELLIRYELQLAAVGTGAGWVTYRLSLTSDVPEIRKEAQQFIASMIRFGGQFGAPAIIGSMQGSTSPTVPATMALGYLTQALEMLGDVAQQHDTVLLYEPLNRYETKIINRLSQGVEMVKQLKTNQVKLLADLFHMNIEEVNPGQALIDAAEHVGHIHYADTNRHAIGYGQNHANQDLQEFLKSGYDGYLSAEIFPLPDSLSAAKMTMQSLNALEDSLS